MIKISKTSRFFLFSLSLVILLSYSVAIAQEDLLDGKVYVGLSRVKHKRAAKGDELRFMNGKFHSLVYDKKGFGGGVYIAWTEEDKIYFETEIVNPKKGRIKWRGIVDGDSIEVNYHWHKEGWLSNTDIDYLFKGKLKK